MKRYNLILFLFIIPFFTSGQISYDHDISLPDTIFGSSAPRDIIYADGKIYVYTLKRILIFDNSKNFLGKIEFTHPPSYGRFALKYPGAGNFTPDAKMMALNPTDGKLYFVTPSLAVRSVNTNSLDTVPAPDNVIDTPGVLSGKKLHGYTKLAYDDDKDRMYWLTLIQNTNFHSWDSYFGVYKKNQSNSDFTNIYNENKIGSDSLNGGYLDVMQTFEYNTASDDFYVSRKKKIDVMEVSANDNVILKKRIPVATGRLGKMLVINDGSIQLLLAFPTKLPYPFPGDPVYEKIYQINTQNPNLYDSINAPSKMTADAIYLPDVNRFAICFINDSSYNQLDTDTIDLAFYQYDEFSGKFEINQILNTQSAAEVDTSRANLNRPFRLMEKTDGDIILTKKNEIINISYVVPGNYSTNTIYYAKDSYFGPIVEAGQKTFVLNMVNSGIEVFNNSLVRETPIRTAYPAFNIAHNPINRKLYFFNRLSTENMGFYIYNLDNGQVETFVETPEPIGDLVYNPIQNNILVSEFSKNVSLRVYDGETGSLNQVITLDFNNYLGRMFIAPNSKLYVSANTKADNVAPKILIRDAGDYSSIVDVAVPLTENDTAFYNLRSYFCYNQFNNKIYATFTPYSIDTPPYQTSYHSSSIPESDPTESPLGDRTGVLLCIESDNTMNTLSTQIESAGELICTKPDTVGPNSSYQGTVFIAGATLHKLDCETNSLTLLNGLPEIVDMTYSPLTNCLYAYSHEIITVDNHLDTNRITVFKIKEDGSFNTIWQKDGFGASLSYNKYDGQLYFYYRNDWRMLGENPAKVFTLDPTADTDAQTGSENLPVYSFFPEMVPQTNNAYFDPNGKAYFPNGMHSSVSVLGFDVREVLLLRRGIKGDTGITWLSIPRHARLNGATKTSTSVVFGQNNISGNLFSLVLRNNNIDENDPPGYEGGMEYANWNPTSDWSYIGDEIDSINSSKGYTLLHSPNENKFLYLYGELEDPQTSMDIYCKKDNWLGYFLYEEQNVFDALADIIDDIYHIQHQYFNCWRHGITIPNECNSNKSTMTDTPGNWVCQGSARNIKYGDMIKVTPFEDIFGFQWNYSGNPPDNSTSQQTAYYTYKEEPAYSTFVIELDSIGDNPVEIGAFVNDTCVGASVVESTDSVVVLSAYLGEHPGDSVVFEQYYGSEKSAGKRIKDYFVRTPAESQKQKRVVKTGGKSNVFIVSFSKGTEDLQVLDNGLAFDIYPNPATNMLYYSLNLNNDRFVSISISDITGKLMAVPVEENFDSGTVKGEIKLISFSGEKLKAGIYLVQLKAGQILETKKVIVN